MNTDNYASLEASKRLVEAGIVLETEMSWGCQTGTGTPIWKLQLKNCHFLHCEGEDYPEYPAPCFTEVWRELPDGIVVNGSYAELYFMKNEHEVNYCGYSVEYHVVSEVKANNPTDALIDLLIWVRKEAKV